MRQAWDIFCTVVDNYGDIGVTWRLARQLVAEHDLQVRLWVDQLAAFVRLCPGADPHAARQFCSGVEVCQWPAVWQPVAVADVVLEAFACSLPAPYLAAMQARARKPLWLNLEYLSAEDWVAGCHALPSLQSGGLQKFFYFPGFTADTGGLLREQGLLQRRDAFQQDAAQRQAFLAGLGVQPAADEQLYSLFTYECASIAGWLQQLARGDRPVLLLVPEGRALSDVWAWLGEPGLAAGAQARRGNLRVQVLPFVSQDDYDRLLWSCDFNAVRGEDSFVRALWAGKPLLWHLYQQAEETHLEKLEAFLQRYLPGLSGPAATALGQFWQAWNSALPAGESWAALQTHWPELRRHALDWSARQAAQRDLAAGLAHFCTNWL
ncbi:elongation factor P maturation arginine rhamnosyltransferase EarP [Pseudomonas sp. N040]|uniref:elongation factor P maturation arginine rhamnosyltransferase EarP n=1 Tax=Pseudomonas sp. N040 TaxID=2785325 RepID=UPI0018A2EE14|nr:elongation factor P maturation arginine rhamnosyltransferase EarP [Pseudomonas sp. N040]MBF7729245.1 elongation factor P maturation arginine rhamnosyltransferase EarP [Pseudomonas sp. N040]MBW7012885.1 elongation factor P maturation arginine rhamnosyltransferase EarP [Pseudomonas sp. N040]